MTASRTRPLTRLIAYIRPYKREYWLGIIYSIINKLFDIAPEVLIGVAVDTVVSQENSWLAHLGIVDVHQQVIALGIITFIIWVCESLSQYLCSVTWLNLSQKIQHDLRLDTYQHLQQVETAVFEKLSSGNLQSIMNADINLLEKFLEKGANQIIQTFTSSIVIGAIFFYLAPQLALAAILPVPLILCGSFYFQNRLGPKFLKIRQRAGFIGLVLANNLAGMLTIKSFTAEKYALEQVKSASRDYVSANKQAIALSSAVTPIIRIAVLIGFLVTLVYGSFLTLEGALAVGSFSVLVFLTQRLLWPLTTLADITIEYQKAMSSTTRVLDLLALPATNNTVGKPLQAAQGKISIKNLYFAYAKEQRVFNNLNLEILPLTSVAFVGSSGAGKTSLIKLLLKLYDPTQGSIFIDDQDISGLSNLSLRQSIGLVSQDPFIFAGSILENIAYGKPDTTREQVIAAAQQAHAHEFITAMHDGYDSLINEHGSNLSGGQKQRIALARTILKQPAILILDEATSALDNETELAIRQSLAAISKHRTTIIVAHRLSTVRHVDHIFVFEKGEIIEQGTHDSLLQSGGAYNALWQLQIGE
jgi:ATP-binding cassette, subfamily B, bacterial